MDPNQNQFQNINQQTPIQPNVNISPQRQSPKFLLPLLAVFALLFISALVMFFANRLSPVTTSGRAATPPTYSPIPAVSKPVVSEEEQELESIDMEDFNKDFQDIQTDVNQL